MQNRKTNNLLMAGVLTSSMLLTGCVGTTSGSVQTVQAESTPQPQTVEESSSASTDSLQTTSNATVTATSTKTDYADPDIATIEIGIESYETSATDAQNEASSISDRTKEALSKLDISEENISTSAYSMYPNYDYDSGDGTNIIGYRVDMTLTVKDIPLDKIGDVLTTATNAGATQISDIRYTSSQYDDVYSTALASATKDARAKAETLAEAEGKQLGDLVTVTEGYQDQTYRYVDSSTSYQGAAEDTASINIDPEQLEIDATVTATYALK